MTTCHDLGYSRSDVEIDSFNSYQGFLLKRVLYKVVLERNGRVSWIAFVNYFQLWFSLFEIFFKKRLCTRVKLRDLSLQNRWASEA